MENYPPEFPELLKSMLAYEPDERPTAREVERRSRALRTSLDDPWLRDYAETAVPEAMRVPGEAFDSDDFSGSIVTEQSSMPKRLEVDPPNPFDGKPPKKRGRGMFGLVTCLMVLLIGGGGALLFLFVSMFAGLYVLDQEMDYVVGDTGVVIVAPTPTVAATPSYALDGQWESFNLPIAPATVTYSDTNTLVLTQAEGDEVVISERFIPVIEKAGFKRVSYWTGSDMVTCSFKKGDQDLVFSVVPLNGSIIITMSFT